MSETRIRIEPDGAIRLPEELLETLAWHGGHYLAVTLDGTAVRLEKVDVDPFAEAMKQPDPDGFDRVLDQQRKSREDAFKTFDERMKAPPEARPEDRPDHWR